MRFNYQSQYPQLITKLDRLKNRVPILGSQWVNQSVNDLYTEVNRNLDLQGRASDRPPPLSEATRQIYRIRGNPDGSGIRNHLRIEYQRQGNRTIGLLGILPQGATVARVQENGAYIRVTPKMRGYLAQFGIFLRADTEFIRIPPRRFWSKANDTVRDRSLGNLRQLFVELYQLN